MPNDAENERFDQPYQIICEGHDDAEFFRRLVRNRAIAEFQVGRSPGRGKDTFGKRIEYIKQLAVVQVKGYVIIADTDDDPLGRFKLACDHLRQHHLPVPTQAAQMARNEQGVKSAILMIPSAAEEGALETILLACCNEANPHCECVDAFCRCIPTPKRKVDRDKVRLRALIASTCLDDPGLSLAFWVTDAHRPFKMDHPALNEICDFLAGFRDS